MGMDGIMRRTLRGEIERRPRQQEAMGSTWQVLTCGTSWRVRKNPSMKSVRANAWTRRMHSSPNPPPHAAMAYELHGPEQRLHHQPFVQLAAKCDALGSGNKIISACVHIRHGCK